MDEPSSSAPLLPISERKANSPDSSPLAGPSGVGWGFLLYLLIFAVVLTISNIILRFILPAGMAQSRCAST